MKEVQGDKEVFDLQDVSKLNYTEQVLMEVMRLYPPSPLAVQRVANEDYHLNDSKLIPRDIPILIPLDALHRDTKYWTNPESFDPDRFSPERKGEFPALAFQPFGTGPRMCIGSRVALTEAKSFLALLLTKYRLVKCPLTDKVTDSSLISFKSNIVNTDI
ncbi:CYP4V2 [Cordylochernes scorpioides]|uniref:CYP4V2 n=1 Tax=Cordylochernes scorpioides TaxID=51811 RepID=A0ABY6LET0_9ARAC|nr:CYP4V2 [Cordylochernes scorpioides]